MKKTKLQKNCNKLEQRIKEQTGWNRSRIFVIVGLIVAIIALGRVNLKKLATKVNPNESKEVNYRRLNRFFQKFIFDKSIMATLMASFISDEEKWTLTLDRTNWKLGKVHINILMLAVAYRGMAVPILWVLLDKKSQQGNSDYKDRIRLLSKFLRLFSVDKIEVLVADREFIGRAWFKWLKKRNIPFAIRIKEGHIVKVGRGQQKVKMLFDHLKVGEHAYYRTRKTIYGYQYLYLVALRLHDEYVVIATNIKQQKALEQYKKRWEIEMLFSAFKKRGFNLEETHMSANQKIDSLISILSIAFVWSHSIGEWLNNKKPIKTLKHGRKEKSIFLYGLEYLAETLLNYEHRLRQLVFIFEYLIERIVLSEIKIDDY